MKRQMGMEECFPQDIMWPEVKIIEILLVIVFFVYEIWNLFVFPNQFIAEFLGFGINFSIDPSKKTDVVNLTK